MPVQQVLQDTVVKLVRLTVSCQSLQNVTNVILIVKLKPVGKIDCILAKYPKSHEWDFNY